MCERQRCARLSTLITVTSNQQFLSSLFSTWLVFFHSLLPSAVEEVYIKHLINKCKAFMLLMGLISKQPPGQLDFSVLVIYDSNVKLKTKQGNTLNVEAK